MAPAHILPAASDPAVSPALSAVIASFVGSLKRSTMPALLKSLSRFHTLPTRSFDVPVKATKVITAREEKTTAAIPVVYGQGAVNPKDINMQGLLALFAILGAAFVVASIWFFFWAKNGGFVWRETDWEDYKSTVLRRKGPDGRTLSNATRSTALGGGSVVAREYRDYDEATTNMDTETVATSEKPRRKGFRALAKEKLLRRQKEETWEGRHDDDMRAYRYEKPAEVGGMNREAEGTYHGSDFTVTNTHTHTGTHEDRSEWTQSEAGHTHNRTHEEKSEWTQSQAGYTNQYEEMDLSRGRNVSGFSFVAGADDAATQITEEEQPLREPSPPRYHLEDGPHSEVSRTEASRSEADRSEVTRSELSRTEVSQSEVGPPENERRSNRARNSNRPRGPRPSASNSRQSSPRKRPSMPGGYTEPLNMSEYSYQHIDGSDQGTGNMSYHRPIPALSKGYRRTGRGRRRDSLSDSDGEDYESRRS